MTQLAQQWLDSKYNNKQTTDDIKLLTAEELTGPIEIKGYDKVKVINLVRLEKGSLSKGKITKVTIDDCKNLEKVILLNNEITEISFIGNFPNLTQLEANNNQLKEINLNNLVNLENLHLNNNPISSQEIEKGTKTLTKIKSLNLLDTPGLNLKNIADDHAGWVDPVDIKKALGMDSADTSDWKDKAKELTSRPTQTDLNDAVKKTEDKYKGYIDPKNINLNDPAQKNQLEQVAKSVGFVDPKDNNALKAAVNAQGNEVISQTDLNNLKNNQEKHTDYDTIKQERDNWETTFPEYPAKSLVDIRKQFEAPKETHTSADLKPADYDTIKVNLAKWTTEFPAPLTPQQVKVEYNKPKEIHNASDLKPVGLPNNWPALINELNNWKNTFPGKNPADVKKDVDSKPATGSSGTGGNAITSAEQYDYLVIRSYLRKEQGDSWRKNMDEWKSKPINVSYIERSKQYFAQIEQRPK